MVVAAGLTWRDPLARTVPIPGSMVTAASPVTFHCREVVLPAVMLAGAAVKDDIAGGLSGVTVIRAVELADPKPLEAVIV